MRRVGKWRQLRLPSDSCLSLEFKIGIQDGNASTDGARFRVELRDEDRTLYELFDRESRWNQWSATVERPLSQFAGRTIDLYFETHGIGDSSGDQAAWGAPTIVSPTDSDGDGLADSWEDGSGTYVDDTHTGTNPAVADGDGDGLNDGDEVLVHNTNPRDPDSDGDGLRDGWEVDNNLDPNDDGTIDPNNGAQGDPDGDGHDNADEQNFGSDPQDSSSFIHLMPLAHWWVTVLLILVGLAFVIKRKVSC